MAPSALGKVLIAGLGLNLAYGADLFLASEVAQETLARALPVFQIDMYRAMSSGSVGTLTEENDDLASLGGVLKYMMTEVIPEYCNSQTRWIRKYGIDAIARERFKVKNKPFSTTAGSKYTPQLVDFGPFATFDQGQSTNPDLDVVYTQEIGDFVGIQINQDPGYAVFMQDPMFWYSVGGFCPNLPWSQMPHPDGQTTSRCVMEGMCDAKGSRDIPNAKCWENGGDVIMGGLCEDGQDVNNSVPEVDPTGESGCTYSYGKPLAVNLDDLTGITQQDCKGGRKCKDWFDFRQNCVDTSLQRMYQIGGTGKIVPAKNISDGRLFCVEFDTHPDCQHDCTSPRCQNSEDYEIAIPFWRGRCDPMANQRRVEALAAAAGIEGALKTHQIVDKDIIKLDATCADPQCAPSIIRGVSHGGPYCSRVFSGTCYNCHIRGASQQVPGFQNWPDCPYGVLRGTDYGPAASPGYPHPECKSAKVVTAATTLTRPRWMLTAWHWSPTAA